MMSYTHVLSFWFDEIKPVQRWRKDTQFDEVITARFYETHQAAIQCELYKWRKIAQGRLAEIIVLDQFSRNMYRDQAESFAYDPMALTLSQEAIACGADKLLNQDERSFLYMPFMHSESLHIHEVAVSLFEANGIQSNLDFEHKHKQIIERFGRYPHRNTILGRASTKDELTFLSQPGSSF